MLHSLEVHDNHPAIKDEHMCVTMGSNIGIYWYTSVSLMCSCNQGKVVL